LPSKRGEGGAGKKFFNQRRIRFHRGRKIQTPEKGEDTIIETWTKGRMNAPLGYTGCGCCVSHNLSQQQERKGGGGVLIISPRGVGERGWGKIRKCVIFSIYRGT